MGEGREFFHIIQHSLYIYNVAINAFYDKEYAQIVHIIKENNLSSLDTIDDYIGKANILNDLDVRASDLLQSNGIIWVEGPSDRIYIKKWLEIFCNCNYKEVRDYQFLYYGGRLLSHYSTEESNNLINIMLTNRNAVIVIDSDKRSRGSQINETKRRIRDEFEKANSFCWITKGIEIENYISKDAIESTYNKQNLTQCGQFEKFPEYIFFIDPLFTGHKVPFARKVLNGITEQNSENILDLKHNIKNLYESIKKWNREV